MENYKKSRRRITHILPILNEDKADTFATHLQNIFTPNESALNSNECPSQTENNRHKTFQNVLLKEFKRELNPKKSAEYDLIAELVITKLPTKGLKMSLLLVNAIFRLMHVPTHWKVAELIINL